MRDRVLYCISKTNLGEEAQMVLLERLKGLVLELADDVLLAGHLAMQKTLV